LDSKLEDKIFKLTLLRTEFCHLLACNRTLFQNIKYESC
jgi:hypothetical protein